MQVEIEDAAPLSFNRRLASPASCDSFTSQQVASWVHTLDMNAPQTVLEQYAHAIRTHKIDGATMNEIDKESLAEIGITSGLHRAKIIGSWKLLTRPSVMLSASQLERFIDTFVSGNSGQFNRLANQAVVMNSQSHFRSSSFVTADFAKRLPVSPHKAVDGTGGVTGETSAPDAFYQSSISESGVVADEFRDHKAQRKLLLCTYTVLFSQYLVITLITPYFPQVACVCVKLLPAVLL
jgi:hypothetical protein